MFSLMVMLFYLMLLIKLVFLRLCYVLAAWIK